MSVYVLLMCLNLPNFVDEGECCQVAGVYREMLSAQRAAMDVCRGEMLCVRRSQVRSMKVLP